MEKKQNLAIAMGLFMVVIMVFSSLTLLFSDQQEPPAPPTPPDDAAQTTSILFESEEFEAVVSDIFPHLSVVGSTSELSIGKIDSEIGALGNVRSLSSRYVLDQQMFSPYGYAADLVLEPGTSPSDFFQKLSADSNYLSSLQGMVEGIVELPEKLAMKNTELGLEKEFVPESHFAKAMLSATTLKNDEIKAQLLADFANEEASNIQAVEIENTTSKPGIYTQEISLPVSWLEEKVLVHGSFDYNSLFSQEEFGQALSALSLSTPENPGVSGLSRKIEMHLGVVLDSNALEEFNIVLQDANISGAGSLTALSDENEAVVLALLSDTSLIVPVKSSLEEIALEYGVPGDGIFFDLPKADFSAELLLGEGSDAIAAAGELESVLGVSIDAKQLAEFDQNHVFVLEEGRDLEVPGHKIEAMISLGKNVGDSVELSLVIIVSRGAIATITGSEKEPEE